MKTLKIKLAAATVACVMATCSVANAAFTISGSVGGAPTGVNKVNFDNLLPLGGGGGTASGPNGSVSVSFVSDGQAVQGTLGSIYAAPYLSGGNGAGFGPLGGNQADGPDTTTFLTSGIFSGQTQGQAILSFSQPQRYMGLLWGSVDDYNTLSFYSGGSLIGAVTGVDVHASPDGDRGVNGTVYVNINSDAFFDKVVATSREYAFEFDNVAYNTNPIPEPATVIAGALLLLPFGISTIRRFRNVKPAA
jgi:hypothetical protein